MKGSASAPRCVEKPGCRLPDGVPRPGIDGAGELKRLREALHRFDVPPGSGGVACLEGLTRRFGGSYQGRAVRLRQHFSIEDALNEQREAGGTARSGHSLCSRARALPGARRTRWRSLPPALISSRTGTRTLLPPWIAPGALRLPGWERRQRLPPGILPAPGRQAPRRLASPGGV